MSCGTWCYKKSERQYTPDEIFVLFKKHINNYIEDCKEIIAGTKWAGEKLQNTDPYYPYESKEEAEEDLIKLNWFIDNVDNVETVYSFKQNYEEVNYGNDLFRGLDYDAPNLYSRKETLNYIKNNKDKVIDVNYDRIKEFWNKYKDGMIDFG